ncbi:cell wall metabolism sensor histidine kinase WalK [Salimicrobium salexigens]|uniref:histidine kinase n=1 Tax=Salimicrobium salexigens TaxID=908941 RepID=A0ABY1KY73_9BACI|nr:cell wall metabolism sensor histidine kinase WalK [Salimicrobium salexigens]SIS92301.1 PAS/PAC sensor signal transduction histidine kinase [Salimicrobium salexigens]
MSKVGFFQSVRLKLIIVYILLILLGLQVIGAYFVDRLEAQLQNNFTESVESRLDALAFNIQQAFEEDRTEEDPSLESDVQSILNSFNEGYVRNEIRQLQVIEEGSNVVIAAYASGDATPQANVGKKTTNPDVLSAFLLQDQSSPETRVDSETGQRLWVGTRTITNDVDETVAAIYFEADMSPVYEELQDINTIFANGTVISIIVTAILGIIVAGTITKPLIEMRRQAQIMATGDFSQKVNVHGNDEIGQLGHTFNDLNDKLKISQATTEGERRKLSSVLSHMSDGVIATDRLGIITLMNAPASHLIGQRFEQVQGKPLIDVLGLEDQVSSAKEMEDLDSVIVDMSTNDQHLLLKANFSVVQDEHYEMNGFITVISDVTEQQRADQERREFVSNVSHELRTPLTTMRSYLEALNDGAWRDEEIAPRFLDVTQNETDRMIRLVNDLLQLTKMDHKESSFYKEKVEFVSFLEQIIERFEMNKREDIQFSKQLPSDNVYVWLDKDKVTQVLDNVISNATKYSPEGGTIHFAVKRVRQKLQVSIKDEGLGMPAHTVEKIFDRFYRVDKARSREIGGTGLGLAIAREIIEAHHGEIWAESQEGKGTTVFFTLPLMRQKRRGNK